MLQGAPEDITQQVQQDPSEVMVPVTLPVKHEYTENRRDTKKRRDPDFLEGPAQVIDPDAQVLERVFVHEKTAEEYEAGDDPRERG